MGLDTAQRILEAIYLTIVKVSERKLQLPDGELVLGFRLYLSLSLSHCLALSLSHAV